MPRHLPHRYRRPGQRVSERAKSNTDWIRERLNIREQRRATIGAEMKFDFSPRVAAARVDLVHPLRAHLLCRKVGADTKGRASTALALDAMTSSHKRRLAGRLRAQLPAAAMRDPARQKSPILSVVAANTRGSCLIRLADRTASWPAGGASSRISLRHAAVVIAVSVSYARSARCVVSSCSRAARRASTAAPAVT